MIYFLILLDVIINNFTNFTSYFFLIYLYKKDYKAYLLTGLILDLVIFSYFPLNTIILSIMYFLNCLFKNLNQKNFYNFVFITLFNYIIYIIISNILLFTDIKTILTMIGYHLVFNLIFYVLAFRVIKAK